MKRVKKFLIFAVLTGLFVSSAGIRTAVAQEKITTCESGGGYNYCGVDTDNNIRLVKLNSVPNCDQNSSWGYDRNGIWVDREHFFHLRQS